MDFEKIKALIELVSETNLSEIKIEQDEFKITIRSQAYTEALNNAKSAANPVALSYPQVNSTQIPIFQQAPNPQNQALSPQQAVEKAPVAAIPTASSDPAADSNLITVRSPMIGTFYRSPSPDKPPFVKIGDSITAGKSVLCIVEAMKLFNEIEAEVSGKIVKLLIDDAAPVEYDQPLFLVEPA